MCQWFSLLSNDSASIFNKEIEAFNPKSIEVSDEIHDLDYGAPYKLNELVAQKAAESMTVNGA